MLRAILEILRYRPLKALAETRSVLLFLKSRIIFNLFSVPGVQFAQKVKAQRISSFVAERPLAKIIVGDETIIYYDTQIEAYGDSEVVIGHNSVIGGANIISRAGIQIGNRTLLSWGIFIQDFDPHPTDKQKRAEQVLRMTSRSRSNLHVEGEHGSIHKKNNAFPKKKISIGSDVWIGANVIILKGVTIGDGSVVAAGSVVTSGTYPENALLAGNPARVCRVFPDHSIESSLSLGARNVKDHLQS